MRLLFLLTQDLNSPAGIGRYFPLARSMVRLGHDVSIAALHSNYDSLEARRLELDGVKISYVSQMHVQKIGSHKTYFSTPKLVSLAGWATWSLSRAALTIPADIIHVGKPHPMNGVAGLIARYTHKKIVFVDCDDLEAANNRYTSSWQRAIVSFFERTIPKRVDHVTTHTYHLRDYFQSHGVPPHKITYLPHGVDLERFDQPDPSTTISIKSQLSLQGKKVVIFVGSMSLVSHAIDILIKSFSRVLKEHPNAVLLLVGGGEDIGYLKYLSQEHGINKSVIFTGRLHPDETPLYYRLADVSVDPIHNNEAGKASLSIKMFESWAAQAPLVTTDVGDRKTILGTPPAGLIAHPDDSESLSNAIIRLLNHPDLAHDLSLIGLNRATEYSWDNLAKKMETVYLRFIQKNNIQSSNTI